MHETCPFTVIIALLPLLIPALRVRWRYGVNLAIALERDCRVLQSPLPQRSALHHFMCLLPFRTSSCPLKSLALLVADDSPRTTCISFVVKRFDGGASHVDCVTVAHSTLRLDQGTSSKHHLLYLYDSSEPHEDSLSSILPRPNRAR